jgi:hypothetical protein
MPEIRPTRELASADAAVKYAQSVRAHHRRRTQPGSKQREADIDVALGRLKDSMRPLRTMIGRFPYGPQTDEARKNRHEIYEASDAIQRERRKLWKMRRKKK